MEKLRKMTAKFLAALLAVMLVFSFVALNISGTKVMAATTANAKIVNVNSYVNVRSGPSTQTPIVTTLSLGARVAITSSVTAQAGDTSGYGTWYAVSFSKSGTDYTGYIANYYVSADPAATITADAAFEAQIASFPESYKPYLRSLHSAHPSWMFQAMNTGLDWSSALDAETTLGKSLVQNSVDDTWKSKASGAYNASTNSYTVVDSPNWINASRAVVAYYMDPRTQMDDSSVFQFLSLNYTTDGEISESSVQSVLNGTFMASKTGAYIDGSTCYYRQMFSMAANISDVNPIFLAARAVQECGTNGSTSSSGASGYYNLFNIGAYSDVYSASMVGLNFARYGTGVATFNDTYLIPWNTPGRSIVGGAKWMSNYYVNGGQNTIYFMRFNVSPSSTTSDYTHQYMTALQSANSESSKMYNAYSRSGLLNNALTFLIPVYNNMPSSAVPLPTSYNVANDYITRVYQVLFDRTPSDSEIAPYSYMISTGTEVVDVTSIFVNTPEFTNKNLTDTEYVEKMYQLLLGRSADTAGMNTMLNVLADGYSRKKVYEDLANSAECRAYIDKFSLSAGIYASDDLVDNNMQYKPFVTMLYKNLLGREYDVVGLRNWIANLATGAISGPQITALFYNSTEYVNSSSTNEQYITSLYNICLGRNPDSDGFNSWINCITKQYHSRDFVLAGFVNSQEYLKVCASYGVSQASYSPKTLYTLTKDTTKIATFVTDLYQNTLERTPDATGFADWNNRIINQNATGYDVAYGFVFSNEMNNRNLTNEQYVTVLYRAILGRDPESAGLSDWTNRLNSGTSRRDVFNGFIYSDEFRDVCFAAGFYPNSSYQ